jgi:hypothetical protein
MPHQRIALGAKADRAADHVDLKGQSRKGVQIRVFRLGRADSDPRGRAQLVDKFAQDFAQRIASSGRRNRDGNAHLFQLVTPFKPRVRQRSVISRVQHVTRLSRRINLKNGPFVMLQCIKMMTEVTSIRADMIGGWG